MVDPLFENSTLCGTDIGQNGTLYDYGDSVRSRVKESIEDGFFIFSLEMWKKKLDNLIMNKVADNLD